jgi:hypothetical protein
MSGAFTEAAYSAVSPNFSNLSIDRPQPLPMPTTASVSAVVVWV